MRMTQADLESRANAGEASAQVRLADQLDGEGRHYEALQYLARAARTHDPEAMAVLGRKLVLGGHAPLRPTDGIGLLKEAAALGDARAAGFLAVISAGGFYAPQDWTAALDYLQRSAELGLEPAGRELAILADAPSDRTWRDWDRLRKSVDLQRWMTSKTPEVLCDAPRVLVLREVAPAAACDWIVEQCASRLVRAEVDDPRTGLPVMGQTRTNRVANFGLGETSPLNILLQARIGAAIGAPFAKMEAFAVLNYQQGEEASDHYDYLDPQIPAYAEEITRVGQRVATVLVYLNEDYEGGETDFPELGIRHKGRRGDALVFFSVDSSGRPDPRTRHAGRPPTSGEKWVLSQFIRNRTMVPSTAPRPA
jgi:prolyl 4-hydroxylase